MSYRIMIVTVLVLVCLLVQSAGAAQIPTDWDLYMLKLVNAARTNPGLEDQIQGTQFNETPVPPLAYDLLVGEAAENHNRWMSLNANNPAINNPQSGSAPDSFAHRETYTGQGNGEPAIDTPGYTGPRVDDRLDYVGYRYSAWGENILWYLFPSPLNTGRIESNHSAWWNSATHRNILVKDTYTVFGHHTFSDSDDHWGTQNYSRPSGSTRTHLFGVLYNDLDGNNKWNPPISPTASSEGIGGVPYRVYESGTLNQIGVESFTFDNGGFSFRAGKGVYDVRFLLGTGSVWVRDVEIFDTNIDLGDVPSVITAIIAGDYNADGTVDAADYSVWRSHLGAPAGTLPGDIDGGVIGDDQYVTWRSNFGNSSGALLRTLDPRGVPEPTSAALTAISLGVLVALRGKLNLSAA
ncbi:MAG: CAP domain-containing protein [Aeoliella sp.]